MDVSCDRLLKVEYSPLDGLIPYAKNARTRSAEHVAAIAASIRAFGWTNAAPVLSAAYRDIQGRVRKRVQKMCGTTHRNRFHRELEATAAMIITPTRMSRT